MRSLAVAFGFAFGAGRLVGTANTSPEKYLRGRLVRSPSVIVRRWRAVVPSEEFVTGATRAGRSSRQRRQWLAHRGGTGGTRQRRIARAAARAAGQHHRWQRRQRRRCGRSLAMGGGAGGNGRRRQRRRMGGGPPASRFDMAPPPDMDAVRRRSDMPPARAGHCWWSGMAQLNASDTLGAQPTDGQDDGGGVPEAMATASTPPARRWWPSPRPPPPPAPTPSSATCAVPVFLLEPNLMGPNAHDRRRRHRARHWQWRRG